MDEVLSGVRSAIAVKIFGSDLEQLRSIGEQVEDVMKTVDGVVDLQLEPQIPISNKFKLSLIEMLLVAIWFNSRRNFLNY